MGASHVFLPTSRLPLPPAVGQMLESQVIYLITVSRGALPQFFWRYCSLGIWLTLFAVKAISKHPY